METIHLDTTQSIVNTVISVNPNTKYLYICRLDGKNARNLKMDFIFDKPNLHSQITFKVVLYDKSSFDFEGILRINKNAKIQTLT